MDKRKEILTLIEELIEQGEKFSSNFSFVSKELSSDCQYWFSKIVSVMDMFSPETSFYNREARSLINASNRQGGIFQENVQRLIGHLKFVRDAVFNGLIIKVEDSITASDYSDFLDHARSYYNAQQKIQAAVIASAVFEDIVRRIGTKNGVSTQNNLDSIINALKSSGIITKVEAKKLKYYAGIRNSALHASWTEFELSDADDLINGVQALIDNHLAGSF
jgi:uncharacterized protein YutE (UPF0331/DUF86 family)